MQIHSSRLNRLCLVSVDELTLPGGTCVCVRACTCMCVFNVPSVIKKENEPSSSLMSALSDDSHTHRVITVKRLTRRQRCHTVFTQTHVHAEWVRAV